MSGSSTPSPARSSACADGCLVAQAMAGLSVGLVLVSPSGRVTWMNRAAANVLGLEPQDCVGEPISHVLRDPQLMAFWHSAVQTDGCLGAVSVRWPRPLELKVSMTRCTDLSGSLLGRALLFCDVTGDRTIQVELSQAVASRLLDLAQESAPATPVAGLTSQELRILRLLGQGLANERIAERAGISTSTVRSHLKSVYRKLGLRSRAEALVYAARGQLS